MRLEVVFLIAQVCEKNANKTASAPSGPKKGEAAEQRWPSSNCWSLRCEVEAVPLGQSDAVVGRVWGWYVILPSRTVRTLTNINNGSACLCISIS